MNGLARLALAGFLSLGTLACASTRRNAVDPADAVAGAAELDRRFVEAFNRGDVEAVAACYAQGPDTLLQPPHPPLVKGWEGVRAHFRGMFAGMKGAHLVITDHVNVPEGDVVIGSGSWTLTFEGSPTPGPAMHGVLFEVKGVRDGKWVYLADCAVVPLEAE